MNHCLRCHKDFSPGDRHIWKCGGVPEECSKCLPENKQALLRQIYENPPVREVQGAFGDTFPNVAYVKETKGIETYFWGCSIPYRLNLDPSIHDSATALKRTLASSFKLVLRFPILFLIRKKRVIEWFYNNYAADFRQKIEDIFFSPLCEELFLKGKKIIEEKVKLLGLSDPKDEYRNKLIESLKAFIAFFQTSTTYHMVLHDFMENMRPTRKGILKALEIVCKRIESAEKYKKEHNIEAEYKKRLGRPMESNAEENKENSRRFKVFKRFMYFVLFVPKARKTLCEYLASLDAGKLCSDVNDFYWYYRRHNYDFGGLSYSERIEVASLLDKQKEHIIFE